MTEREELIAKIGEALNALSKVYPEYNCNSQHNRETPRRIADTWIEMCKGYGGQDFDFTCFPADTFSQNPVVLKDIEFNSFCVHHFLPFFGTVSIGYFPKEKICGVSKLARAVEYMASKPQVQEELGQELLTFLLENLDPHYVFIEIKAKHTCVSCRGIKSRNSEMITHHVGGPQRTDADRAYNVIREMLK